MPVTIRPDRRFPVHGSVTYNAGPFQGQGTVWNLSLSGVRLSGDFPLRIGQTCSLNITFPNDSIIFVPAAIVRWVPDQDYGLESLVVDTKKKGRIEILCAPISTRTAIAINS